ELLDLLPVRGTPAPDVSEADDDVPGFRPLSFLTTIADRMGERATGESAGSNDGTGVNGRDPVVPAVDPTDGTVVAVPARESRDAVWARVQLARSLRRPRTLEFAAHITQRLRALHGERAFGRDP